MKLSGLLSLVDRLPGYGDFLSSLVERKPLSPLPIPEAARPYFFAALRRHLAVPLLVVVPRRDRAQEIYDQLRVWSPEPGVYLFREPDVLPYERIPWDRETIQERLEALATTVSDGGWGEGCAPVFVTTARGLAQKTIPRSAFLDRVHRLGLGEEVSRERLLSSWLRLAYKPVSIVEEPGTFSVRGGIIDIFPPGSVEPVRIELLGEEVESLRTFDPATQRSRGRLSTVTITVAREALPQDGDRLRGYDLSSCNPQAAEEWGEELAALSRGEVFPRLEFYLPLLYDQPGSLLDHLPQALVILDDPLGIERALSDLEGEMEDLRRALEERGELPFWMESPCFTKDEIQERLSPCPSLEFRLGEESELASSFAPSPSYGGLLEELVVDSLEQKGRVVLVSRQASRLAEIYSEWGTSLVPSEGVTETPPPGAVILVQGGLSRGWQIKGHLVLLTDAEIFGWAKPKPRRLARPRPWARESFFADVREGDYVVHIDHGIGVFKGLVTLATDGFESEYLHVGYAAGDSLYVPTYQADRLSRYVGAQDRPPRIDRLGTTDWARVKARAKRAVEDIAQELLALYSLREVVEGHAFSPDTPWQRDLEASFPYVETEDQLKALEETKADMEKSRPMDRLICGDVGYGKTEVALRAAFKAVMDGKQVAILVPTTVLAQQHYRTFTRRLRPFPVEVDMLSRFRSPREQAAILRRLREGSLEIVIGTHRLLSQDVVFRDLGLLIIDEEQRFGVAHKERLKEMRHEVDVLTLTATPIPRTLYMSLTGVRDMSTIDTPPEERLPVVTQVSPYDESLIRRAVLRELDRGGQVYFVHNRVRGIRQMAKRLVRIVPEATVAIAHGQMDERELARTMLEFADGQYDILVCTSIIENGIDIPNVNTLIVNRADRFGLAQLYQLRGRVGRSSSRAYAYFLYDEGYLSEEARRRLQTIQEASELGSGFRIALRDLEIRGAGDILGSRQHGHISAVGFDLYCRLLAQAVRALSMKDPGGKEGREIEEGALVKRSLEPSTVPFLWPSIDLPLEARLPEGYVEDESLRLGLYRRLAGLTTIHEVEEMREELRDRFGSLPQAAENLLYLLRLRILGWEGEVQAISTGKGRIIIELAREKEMVLPRGAWKQGNRVTMPFSLQDEAWPKRLENLLKMLAGG
ncbi:MAG: transcription-repair coupling factor [Anaerolineae bacterium]